MPYASSNATIDQVAVVLRELLCPYFGTGSGSRCSAANMEFTVNNRQRVGYCCSDDHDRCPLFLAKALRAQRR